MPKKPKIELDPSTWNDARLADEIYLLREDRLAIERQAESHKKREAALKALLRDRMIRANQTRIGGLHGQISCTPELVAEIVDWDKYWAYIGKTKSWDLLQKRPHQAAIDLRWEAGTDIPGCKKNRVYNLHVSKVSQPKE